MNPAPTLILIITGIYIFRQIVIRFKQRNNFTPFHTFEKEKECEIFTHCLPSLLRRGIVNVTVMVRKDFKAYSLGGGWGRNITWEPYKDNSCRIHHCGHFGKKPRVGDIIVCKGRDNITRMAIFTKIKETEKVGDMFFAESTSLGHLTAYPDELIQKVIDAQI
jgi:hypothetical protein